MAKHQKFNYQIKQDQDTWTAEITRRVSARKTAVSKKQTGFTNEKEAIEWAEKELPAFLEKQKVANTRKSEKRATREALAAKALAEKEASQAEFEAKQQAYLAENDGLPTEQENDQEYDFYSQD